jgi:sigma-54-interacting transcriptional regulator
MSAAIGIERSLLETSQTEWTILRARRNNVILEGPVDATNAALHLLQPHIREPIVWNRPQEALELPSEETRALILRDVASLNHHDQTRLLVWIGGSSHTQIISTTERPLFALIAQGLFDETLYYRLNVMLLHVGSNNPPGVRADDEGGRWVDRPTTVPARRLA